MKELNLILKSIKNKTLLPLYVFHGEEPFYTDMVVKSFENDVLEEDEKAFNQTVVYGKDTNLGEILSLARQYPMMGEKQLLVVKEAQDLKWGEEESEAFSNYIESPVESTILVLAFKHKKLDSRKKFVKKLSQKNYLFESEKIKDYKLSEWIAKECETQNIKTTPNIPNLLAEYLGNDLSRITNELNKLKIFLKNGQVLNEKLVEEHIGISKDFNVFELQNKLAEKNEENAMRIAFFMGKSKTESSVQKAVGILFGFFSNLIIYHTLKGQSPQHIASEMNLRNSFFLKDYALAASKYNLKHCTRIISILRETDLKSKGLGANQIGDAELLKEMTYKILNVDKVKIKI